MEFGEQLLNARRSVGLSQAALAKLASTSQARLSSYESGSVIPTRATQDRLLRAAHPLPSVVLDSHREDVTQLAAKYDLADVRVFGSVARGQDTHSSDIDLLVTPGPDVSMFDIIGFALEVEDLLGYHVDVASDRVLPPGSSIARDAQYL